MANVELVKAIKNGNVVTSLGELAAGDTVTMKGDGASAAGAIRVNNAANTFTSTLESGNISSNITLTLPTSSGTLVSSGALLASDSSPQLSADLDVNGNSIVSASNGNITFQPNGTGVVDFKNDNTQTSEVRLYCESNNSHYVALKSDVHANYSGSVTLTLPTTTGTVALTSDLSSYAPLAGSTFTGDVSINAELLVDSYNETYSSVTSSTNSTTINCETANVFNHVLTENTTFTFSSPPASGTSYTFALRLVQDSGASGFVVTWPTSVDWPGTNAPTLTATASAVDWFVFTTSDGGTTWYGFTAGLELG